MLSFLWGAWNQRGVVMSFSLFYQTAFLSIGYSRSSCMYLSHWWLFSLTDCVGEASTSDMPGMLFIKYKDNEGKLWIFHFPTFAYNCVEESLKRGWWWGEERRMMLMVMLVMGKLCFKRERENGLIILLQAIHIWIDWISEWNANVKVLFVFGFLSLIPTTTPNSRHMCLHGKDFPHTTLLNIIIDCVHRSGFTVCKNKIKASRAFTHIQQSPKRRLSGRECREFIHLCAFLCVFFFFSPFFFLFHPHHEKSTKHRSLRFTVLQELSFRLDVLFETERNLVLTYSGKLSPFSSRAWHLLTFL